MSDPENFISRWSRRKHEAAAEDAQQKQTDANEVHAPASDEQTEANSGEPAASPPGFDISSLPSIESIDAGTDITVFMQPGVPAAMRHAALRRAWSADPAIRDFMGPTENFWDAAGPEGVPGFGDLDPNLDVKRLVSELFGETSQPERAQKDTEAEISSIDPDSQRKDIPGDAIPPAAESDLSQCTGNVAAQNESSESEPAKKIARRHGGAMPR
jgi:uncharacterized protein DUF3306